VDKKPTAIDYKASFAYLSALTRFPNWHLARSKPYIPTTSHSYTLGAKKSTNLNNRFWFVVILINFNLAVPISEGKDAVCK